MKDIKLPGDSATLAFAAHLKPEFIKDKDGKAIKLTSD
jgi:hypothetical protein